MIKLIKHHWHRLTHLFRDVGTGAKRSGHWRTLEKKMIAEHPFCSACGIRKEEKGSRLQVHHIKSFHKHPNLELQESNLIVLCFSIGRECHLRLGHGSDWHAICPDVIKYAEQVRTKEKTFEEVEAFAKAHRVY